MAGLVPAIHVFAASAKKDVDARNKSGHDGERAERNSYTGACDVAMMDFGEERQP
jgi:hypothetical protein